MTQQGDMRPSISIEKVENVMFFNVRDNNNVQIGNNNVFQVNSPNYYDDDYDDDDDDDDDDYFSQEQEQELYSSNAPLDEEMSQIIATEFQKQWYDLGTVLQISQTELDDLSQLSLGMQEMAYNVLTKWKETHENATLVDLAECFKENDEYGDDEKRKMLYKLVTKQKVLALKNSPKEPLAICN